MCSRQEGRSWGTAQRQDAQWRVFWDKERLEALAEELRERVPISWVSDSHGAGVTPDRASPVPSSSANTQVALRSCQGPVKPGQLISIAIWWTLQRFYQLCPP